MTRTEHLLVILAEECNEVAHRVAKALRFGLEEIEPGNEYTNAQRILLEHEHVETLIEMLKREGKLPTKYDYNFASIRRNEKRKAVEKYLEYARALGTLKDEPK